MLKDRLRGLNPRSLSRLLGKVEPKYRSSDRINPTLETEEIMIARYINKPENRNLSWSVIHADSEFRKSSNLQLKVNAHIQSSSWKLGKS